MSYQVLARKWRPQKFLDVIGQDHVLTALSNSLSSGRVHHAHLFSGTRGVGKTTIARLLAKGLNCEIGIMSTPCGQCINCQEIEQGRFIDLIEIDAASKTKVEDTRELLDNIQYAPARGRFKIYLIDEVHMLSRHSFNALLKTLEEPPLHIKFLMATTEPRKLPPTVLSRCLQFHLKALDTEQIFSQLQRTLIAEEIISDVRALQLLAQAADGSMRDALSLTDQAIAMGQGQVNSSIVTKMLGTIDDEQPLAIIEALAKDDGKKVMAQIAQVAELGLDWENLLVETLTLLHRIAMMQLLPVAPNQKCTGPEQRLRALARTLPPEDVQLYYQTLLIGRKELTYAPDRRMGVEMTMLRALAFHPKILISEQKNASTEIMKPIQKLQSVHLSPPLNQVLIPKNQKKSNVSDTTVQLLKARSQVRRGGAPTGIKVEQDSKVRSQSKYATLERLASVTQRSQKYQSEQIVTKKQENLEAYHRYVSKESKVLAPGLVTPKSSVIPLIANKKSSEVSTTVCSGSSDEHSAWVAEIIKLNLPKLIKKLALSTFKQQHEPGKIYLHIRSEHRHLNSLSAHKVLSKSFSKLYGRPIEVNVIIDDNNSTDQTILEWRKSIYEAKLSQARESIITDTNVQALRRLFDAELDEDSIRPI